jgi:fused signal recognition particle receptor
MLGWFKKKFGAKTEEPVAVEPAPSEVAAEEVAAPSFPTPIESSPEPSAATSAQDQDEIVATEAVVEAAVAAAPAPVVEVGAMAPVEGLDVAAEVFVEALCDTAAPDLTGEESAEDATPADIAVAPELPIPEAPVIPELVEQGEEGAESAPDQEPVAAPEASRLPAEPVVLGREEAAAPEAAEVEVPASVLASTREKPAAKSMFQRLQERLGKTKESLVYRLDRLFLGKKEIDQDLFEQLEEILITADLGVGTTLALLDEARKKVKRDQLSDPQALKTVLRDQILAYIEATDQPAELVMPAEGPFVIMVVGVNGVGKTTSIGKIAAKFKRAGQSVLLVAGDTFRAAAINQLKIWGERVGVEVIAQHPGADPSSVVFDGLEYGVVHNHDVIIIDTAGRLHTSVNLMEELKKIKRVVGKKMAGAPHEVMLVLDANTGQNGVSQAKLFHEAVGVTGLTLTKLDGTAKGGIVANVCREIRIPVRFIGIGEQIDDLRDFDAREFVDALFDRQRE